MANDPTKPIHSQGFRSRVLLSLPENLRKNCVKIISAVNLRTYLYEITLIMKNGARIDFSINHFDWVGKENPPKMPAEDEAFLLTLNNLPWDHTTENQYYGLDT